MGIYAPMFKKDREIISKYIIEFVKSMEVVSSLQIHAHILTIKKEKPDEIRVGFLYLNPYSDFVEEVIVDLIRHCILKETCKGLTLTNLGKSKNTEELVIG